MNQRRANGAAWLIVGGLGYIGAHISREFSSIGIEHTVLDNLASGILSRAQPEIPLVIGSIEAAARKEVSVPPHLTGVVHVASVKNARDSVRDPIGTYESVVGGTLSALRVAASSGARNFIFSSSCSVYGEQTGVTESTPIAPVSPYGKAKYIAEQLVVAAAHELNMTAFIFRYFNVIGAGSFPFSQDVTQGHIVPNTLNSLREGRSPTITAASSYTPDGSCIRDYVDVRDVARAHSMAVEKVARNDYSEEPIQIVNLCTGIGISTLTLVDEIMKQWPSERGPAITWKPPATGDPASIFGGFSDRAESTLGWRPQHDFASSISSVVAASFPMSEDIGGACERPGDELTKDGLAEGTRRHP